MIIFNKMHCVEATIILCEFANYDNAINNLMFYLS